ncbi:TetR/AcrR family transcriptional regulator [Gordonia desulfuricans]|uniref:TetR/AcrR family transcriptional regulator n=1 Tax=Gordonia desulfuricans TaxID=89051 RepID=A0A7K3LU30_9ACTN|nr:TetR/AcrR family transcriptional regulator [Gordonia desulfuricans]NDK91087.1 TetR/AcrR family transcriptional regulator [Gordonia desulfuricans]
MTDAAARAAIEAPRPPVTPDPPTPKGRDTRDRLLAAATTLFAERGYAGVRITDITKEAGLSGGAFYRYFTDRREIMLVLLQDLTDEAFEFIRVPWDDTDPMDAVMRSTELYFTFYESHRALFGLLAELGQTDPEVSALWARARQAFYSRFAHVLRRGVESDRLRAGVNVEVAAEMICGMTEFYAFQRYALRDGVVTAVTPREAARTLAEIWASGILRQP